MNSAQKKQIEEVAPEAEPMAKKKKTAKTATNAELDSDDEPLGEKVEVAESSKGAGAGAGSTKRKSESGNKEDSDEEALGEKLAKKPKTRK